MKKLLIISLFVLVISSCSYSTDNTETLVNENKVNWCIGETNNLIVSNNLNRFDDEDYTALTLFNTSWEIMEERNIINSGKNLSDRYANGDFDLYLRIKEEFLISKNNDKRIYNDVIEKNEWDLNTRLQLHKYSLFQSNEYALKHCKIWEEISY